MWEYVTQAGIVGYILVGLSVLSGGVILERVWFWLIKGHRLGQSTRDKLLEAFRQGDQQRVTDLIATKPSSPEAHAFSILNQHWRNSQDDSPVEIAVSRVVKTTNRWLTVLDVNGTIAPMFGILGTVIGIIQAFEGMHGASPDPRVMVSGISVSMLTTAIGLVVALFSIVPYNIFASKAHRYQTELAEFLQECWMTGNGSHTNANKDAEQSTKNEEQ